MTPRCGDPWSVQPCVTTHPGSPRRRSAGSLSCQFSTAEVSMVQPDSAPISERELTLERVIDATPEHLFRAWTEPDHLKQWYCPKPWTVASAELDVRPGGSNTVIMCSPEGQEHPNHGAYLDVVRNDRLVFTDALVEAWAPSEKVFLAPRSRLSLSIPKPGITQGFSIGMSLIGKRTKPCGSMKAGAKPPINWRNWPLRFEFRGTGLPFRRDGTSKVR